MYYTLTQQAQAKVVVESPRQQKPAHWKLVPWTFILAVLLRNESMLQIFFTVSYTVQILVTLNVKYVKLRSKPLPNIIIVIQSLSRTREIQTHCVCVCVCVCVCDYYIYFHIPFLICVSWHITELYCPSHYELVNHTITWFFSLLSWNLNLLNKNQRNWI